MSYDGTVTIPDPYLVAVLDDMPDGIRAYVRTDLDASAPDWDGIGYVYRIGHGGARADDMIVTGDGHETAPMPVGTVRAAWDRYRDWTLVGRYLRAFHDVVSFDWADSADRDGTLVACVTRSHVAWWGVMPSGVADLARDALDIVGAWYDGSVYVVTVVDTTTGAERSLCDVYDSSPDGRYLREVARDLVADLRDGA